MSAIAELWRLPDKHVTRMDGSPYQYPVLAIRQGNWHGWYRILPDYGGHINTIPEGSIQLIREDEWLI